MTSINRKDLETRMGEQFNLTKSVANKYIQFIFDQITETLIEGGQVDIYGFGRFSVTNRKGRIGVNPSNGEKMQILPSKNVKFKSSKTLKDSLK